MHSRKCEICNIREARYVCTECGRTVCAIDFDPTRWICIECRNKLFGEEAGITYISDYSFLKYTFLIFIGFILITLGFILLSTGYIEGGSVTIIFPFIITTDPVVGFGMFIIFIIVMIFIIYYIFKRGMEEY